MSSSDRLKQVAQHISPDTPLLKDQVVLITGGAQGIGKATATLFASHGAKLFLSDIDPARMAETIAELQGRGFDAASLVGDVLDETFADRLVKAAVERFGRINCLINNAGFCYDSAVHKMTDAKFDVIMKVHNYAPFRLIRALSPYWMDKANKEMPKCIINVSSTSGLHGSMGQINYSTAKAGVIGMTKSVAAEWGRYGVRVNAVAYGWIDTRITRPPSEEEALKIGEETVIPGIPLGAKKWRDLSDIPLGRVGTADDAAGVMLFLASPLAAYVTGTCVECTGGRFM